MVDETTRLDEHRGMMAQKATELRRLRVEVEVDQAALRARRKALERLLSTAPASCWSEAIEKANYLLSLLPKHRLRPTLADKNSFGPSLLILSECWPSNPGPRSAEG